MCLIGKEVLGPTGHFTFWFLWEMVQNHAILTSTELVKGCTMQLLSIGLSHDTHVCARLKESVP